MSKTINIWVGLEETCFSVPRAFICASSNLFTNKDDAPQLDYTFLGKEDPDTFNIYLHWLYCKTIPIISAEADQEPTQEYTVLARCHLRGLVLKGQKFLEVVLDTIQDCARNPVSRIYRKQPESLPITLIYENYGYGITSKRTPHRHLGQICG